VAVGTLYNHYQDKDTLLMALLEARRTALAEKMDGALAAHPTGPFRERLAAFLGAIFAEFASHRRYVQIIVAGDAYLRPRRRAGHVPALQLIEARAAILVEAGVRQRCLRAAHAEVYPAALAALVRAVLRHCQADEASYGRAAELVATLFLEGVARP
jgi:AcrR family transcriptional regulator